MSGMAHTSGDSTRHLQKLASLVAQRRVALGFASKEAAAEACGISHTTYRKVEFGQPVRGTTYAKLEVGFGLRAGTIRAVIEDGVDAIVLEDGTELIEGGQIRDFKRPDLEEEVDRAFTKSAQLTAPHLTLSEAKAMKDEMFRELRARGVLNGE